MSGRIVAEAPHDCGWKPTARRAGDIWKCDVCGRRWIYRQARNWDLDLFGRLVPPAQWRWEPLTAAERWRSWWSSARRFGR